MERREIDPEWLRVEIEEKARTFQAIAQELGVTRQEVEELCQKLGIKIKTASWYAKRWGYRNLKLLSGYFNKKERAR